MVKSFLSENKTFSDTKKSCTEYNYQDLADWYNELSYTWLRIRSYTDKNDVTKSYMWGIMLQHELNRVCDDFGIEKFELMSHFNSEKLTNFATHSSEIEKTVRKLIADNGGVIREYNSFEDFINEV